MSVQDTLELVKTAAKKDEDFRRQLLETRNADRKYHAFCELCTNAGFEISVMDLVNAGEESYAAMRRSTNGGGENSPLLAGEDDLYEMFLMELE